MKKLKQRDLVLLKIHLDKIILERLSVSSYTCPVYVIDGILTFRGGATGYTLTNPEESEKGLDHTLDNPRRSYVPHHQKNLILLEEVHEYTGKFCRDLSKKTQEKLKDLMRDYGVL